MTDTVAYKITLTAKSPDFEEAEGELLDFLMNLANSYDIEVSVSEAAP